MDTYHGQVWETLNCGDKSRKSPYNWHCIGNWGKKTVVATCLLVEDTSLDSVRCSKNFTFVFLVHTHHLLNSHLSVVRLSHILEISSFPTRNWRHENHPVIFFSFRDSCADYILIILADINECGLKPHPCEHRCMNTHGSYKCYCLNGYMLMPDGTCASKYQIISKSQ